MSGAAPARETRDRHGLKKTAPTSWYTPPSETPLYAAIPRPAPLHEDALSGLQSRLYAWLTDPRRAAQNEDKSWTLQNAPPYETMARDLRVSKSSIWRAFKLPESGLFAKCSVQAYEVFYPGGKRRKSTSYFMPSFGAVLKARRALPGIVLTEAGHPIVIGRRRRFMTRELAAAWGIVLSAVPATSRQQPKAPPVPMAPPVEPSIPAAPATGPPDFAAIREVLFEFAHRGDDSDCSLVYNAALGGNPEPSIEDVAGIARAACQDRRRLHPEKPQTVNFIRGMVEARVKDWRERQRKVARDTGKQRQWAREARVNNLCELLRKLAHLGDGEGDIMPDGEGKGGTCSEREFLTSILREADAAEVIEARAVLAAIQARQARKA